MLLPSHACALRLLAKAFAPSQCRAHLHSSRKRCNRCSGRAGDDMIAIHGRMYTVGAIASPNITVGAYTSDLTVGDTIMLYSNVGKPTGSAVIKTIVSVPIPPGIDPNSYDSVFGNQFGGYAWWRVRVNLSLVISPCAQDIVACCVRQPACCSPSSSWYRLHDSQMCLCLAVLVL